VPSPTNDNQLFALSKHGGHVASLDYRGHCVTDQLCVEFIEALMTWKVATLRRRRLNLDLVV